MLWQKTGWTGCELYKGRLFQLCQTVAKKDLSLFVQYFSKRGKANQGFFTKIMRSQTVEKLQRAQTKINKNKYEESYALCEDYIDKKRQSGCLSGCFSGLCNFFTLFNQNVPSLDASVKRNIYHNHGQ